MRISSRSNYSAKANGQPRATSTERRAAGLASPADKQPTVRRLHSQVRGRLSNIRRPSLLDSEEKDGYDINIVSQLGEGGKKKLSIIPVGRVLDKVKKLWYNYN